MSNPRTTVYFDGACPLCRREIALLKKWDKKDRLLFRDISPPQAAAVCPLPQKDMLARFHVRRSDGVMLIGAEAFCMAYAQIPGLGWVERLGRWRASRVILNALYWLFLKIRPVFQWVARRFDRKASTQ